MFVYGAMTLVHRYSWAIHFGIVQTTQRILHKCDNTVCVNPSHLTLGTQADNVYDMITKGRHVAPKGEDSGNVKLTEEQVKEIRSTYRPKSKRFGLRSLSDKYGVTKSTIAGIIRRKSWKHV